LTKIYAWFGVGALVSAVIFAAELRNTSEGGFPREANLPLYAWPESIEPKAGQDPAPEPLGLATAPEPVALVMTPFALNATPEAIFLADSADTGDTLPYPFEDTDEGDIFQPDPHAFNLGAPAAVQQTVTYDPVTGQYTVTQQVDGTPYRPPTYYSFEEFIEAESQKSLQQYWQERSQGESLLSGGGWQRVFLPPFWRLQCGHPPFGQH